MCVVTPRREDLCNRALSIFSPDLSYFFSRQLSRKVWRKVHLWKRTFVSKLFFFSLPSIFHAKCNNSGGHSQVTFHFADIDSAKKFNKHFRRLQKLFFLCVGLLKKRQIFSSAISEEKKVLLNFFIDT